MSANHTHLYNLSSRKALHEHSRPKIQSRKNLLAWRLTSPLWRYQKDSDTVRHIRYICLKGKSISETQFKEKIKVKRKRYYQALRQNPIQLGRSRAGYIICGFHEIKMRYLLSRKLGEENVL